MPGEPATRAGRVAIVHERFTELGGAEAVVEAMHSCWPDATVLAPIVDRSTLPAGLRDADVRPGSLQRLYPGRGRYAHVLPLLPWAFAHLDLRGFDLVLTSHHAFANRVRPPRGVPVISYTHSPARWMWQSSMLTNEQGGVVGRAGLRACSATQRRADVAAARRLTGIIVNSHSVAERVRRWWGRDARGRAPAGRRVLLHARSGRSPRGLLPLGRAPRSVQAARPRGRCGRPCRRPARRRWRGRRAAALEAADPPGVEWLGRVEGEQLRSLYRRCRALVFPGEEDFGIVPVEAQACGAPVIAARVGGALDSVVDGVTGVFFDPAGDGSDVATLAGALETFRPEAFDVVRDPPPRGDVRSGQFSAQHVRGGRRVPRRGHRPGPRGLTSRQPDPPDPPNPASPGFPGFVKMMSTLHGSRFWSGGIRCSA